jgi:hypothetical protein
MKQTTSILAAVLVSVMAATSGAEPAQRAELPGLQNFLGCGKVPAGKDVVKLNLLPQSRLADIMSFMTSISCKPFVAAAGVDLKRTLDLSGTRKLTTEQLYRLFITALASLDLTVRPTGKALEIAPRG